MADINREFRAWTTGTAFHIDLNEAAIKQIVRMLSNEDHWRKQGKGDDLDWYGDQIFERGRVNYLMKRGLIRRCVPSYKGGNTATVRQGSHSFEIDMTPSREGYENNYVLTDAGTLVGRLLNTAGFFAPAHHVVDAS